MKNNKILKVCPICKKEFKSYIVQNRKYCSLKCKYSTHNCFHLKSFQFKKEQLSWNKGLKCLKTSESKKTGIYSFCDVCKTKIYISKFRINRSKNHFCSKSCNNRFRVGIRGRNYIDGRSFEEYPQEFNKKVKEIIKNRDKRICVLCAISEEEHKLKYNKSLSIHHIDYNKQNCKEDNLITLCLKHNSKVNKIKSRKRWIKCFKIILELM